MELTRQHALDMGVPCHVGLDVGVCWDGTYKNMEIPFKLRGPQISAPPLLEWLLTHKKNLQSQ